MWAKVVAVGVFLLGIFLAVASIFGVKRNDPSKIVDNAKDDADAIKAAADAELAVQLQDVEADKAALVEVEKISDDKERLAALAKLGNRRW